MTDVSVAPVCIVQVLLCDHELSETHGSIAIVDPVELFICTTMNLTSQRIIFD